MSDTPDPELLRKLEAAVANLPRIQREIFLAHRRDNMPYGGIASRTGLSAKHVERHMARAIYKLVKQLDGHRLGWWERWF